MTICSIERPWGIHPAVRSDGECPRCGWTAPGPKGDALEAAEQARAWEAELGWVVHESGAGPALAA
ncbi:MAG TPA: hypothetical protein VF548_03745 [Allosphingosinicella sp.]|jgi:hypothetical protein